MTKIRVVAAIVDTQQLTLYREDGKTVLIPQGDPRLRPIIDEIRPIIAEGLVAEVDITGTAEDNVYAGFQEQSKGLTRFFRVAKQKVASFFGTRPEESTGPVAPMVIGIEAIPTDSLGDAVEDIIANAVPATASDFDVETSTDHTVVAVVGKGAAARAIPGMENLKDQFAHAIKMGSTIGVQRFLERISAVIGQRQHSIYDLLRFMERGDLPIADDGSIVIYKILRRSGSAYVDCHSGKVVQRVGSYVCMDPSMVDPNRRNECSNGLHVARRGYLGNFGGDVCVLAKVNPEDVIAVPNYDANKMRVCGYHILFEIPTGEFETLKRNKPMTDSTKAQKLLGRAIAGDHAAPQEEVRITQAKGGGVITTPLLADGTRKQVKVIPTRALDDKPAEQPVDPRQVAADVAETKAARPAVSATQAQAPARSATLAKVAQSPRQSLARELFEAGNMAALIAFKKASKVSWGTLGFSEAEMNQVLANATQTAKPAPVAKAPISAPVGISRKEAARQLYRAMMDVGSTLRARQEAARNLQRHKKVSKLGWGALGLQDNTPNLIVSILDPKPVTPAREPKLSRGGGVVGSSGPGTKAKKAPAPKANPTPPPFPTGTRKEIARALFVQGRYEELIIYRKSVKLGWAALGVTTKDLGVLRAAGALND